MVRILLVDDHIIFRDGLKALINNLEGFEVVAEAENGNEALIRLSQISVDLLITDLHMPELDGISLITELKKSRTDFKVIVLTMDSERYLIDKIMDLGADGYVTKSTSSENLKNVMQSVMKGQNQFLLVMSEHEAKNKTPKENDMLAQLTKREKEVLTYIAQGFTDKKIAELIFLSVYTVTTHRKNLLGKLGLSNKVELARFALQNGIGVN